MSSTYVPNLDSVTTDTRGGAAWWLAVSRALDDLIDHLASDEAEDEGPTGTLADAVWDAPNLAPSASRLTRDRRALMERAQLLRRRLSDVAGDPDEVAGVAHELEAIAADERSYRRRSRAIVVDSVNRDIGGE